MAATRDPDEAPDARGVEESEAAHAGGERPLVLIIDDDRDIRETLATVLEAEGLACEVAQNGADAFERLQRMPRRPQLIVLDLMMPVMNGWDFRAAQLADPALASVPTLVLTAATDAARKTRDLGDVVSLRKPTDLDVLMDAIESLLPGWQPE